MTDIFHGFVKLAAILVNCVLLHRNSLTECANHCGKVPNGECASFALENEHECKLGREIESEKKALIATGSEPVYYSVKQDQTPGPIHSLLTIYFEIENIKNGPKIFSVVPTYCYFFGTGRRGGDLGHLHYFVGQIFTTIELESALECQERCQVHSNAQYIHSPPWRFTA